jgi:hypothetical protein
VRRAPPNAIGLVQLGAAVLGEERLQLADLLLEICAVPPDNTSVPDQARRAAVTKFGVSHGVSAYEHPPRLGIFCGGMVE